MEKVDQLLSRIKLDKRDLFLVLFNIVAVFIMATLQHLHLATPHIIASILSIGGPIFKK